LSSKKKNSQQLKRGQALEERRVKSSDLISVHHPVEKIERKILIKLKIDGISRFTFSGYFIYKFC